MASPTKPYEPTTCSCCGVATKREFWQFVQVKRGSLWLWFYICRGCYKKADKVGYIKFRFGDYLYG